MTLPIYQRCGYGRLLIEFSYQLSRREGLAGTPEKPLSDLGKISYQSFWKWSILKSMQNKTKTTVEEISKSIGMNVHDIAATLQQLNLIFYQPLEDGTPNYEIRVEKQLLEGLKKPRIAIEEEALRWTPLVAPFQSMPPANGAEETTGEGERWIKSGPVPSRLKSATVEVTPVCQSAKKGKKRRRRRNKTGYERNKRRKSKPPGTDKKVNLDLDENSQRSEAFSSQNSQAEEDSEATEEETEEDIEKELQRATGAGESTTNDIPEARSNPKWRPGASF